MDKSSDFWVKFWGVRGTVPCPGAATIRYGGNTACLEVHCGGHCLIFDAGTGIRALGASLAGKTGLHAHIFLTHAHIDHVIGFPFFRPAYDCRNRFELWAGRLSHEQPTVHAVLKSLMSVPIFPVPLDIMHACIAFHDFSIGEVLTPMPQVTIRTAPLNHPQGATAYRIEFNNKSICYVTDTEHQEGQLDLNILDLIGGSDIVIYDATYTETEYQKFKDWGHSTWRQGALLCDAAGARQLVAFHHDPCHDDAFMDQIAAEMGRVRPGSVVAREGMVLWP